MISQHDLYDIAKALIYIRDDIQSENNIEILSSIILVLNRTVEMTEDNQVRKVFRTLKNLDAIRWNYIYYDNVYTHHYLLKDENVYILLKKLCMETISLLEQKNFNRAYDLVDMYHCLPEIIANNNFTIPKSYWKIFVKYYRKKWDKRFLRFEQKVLKR